MIAIHTSDIHGSARQVLKMMELNDFDIWIDTGDFFPERTMGIKQVEVPYQNGWWEYHELGKRFAELLDGRPVLTVAGNHDHVDLAELLRIAGATAHRVAEAPVTLGYHVFYGFEEIPYIGGHWDCETHNFVAPLARVKQMNPTILLTHAPPHGVLDHHYGIPELASFLQYEDHRIERHFFGHVHEHGGQKQMLHKTVCINGATCAILQYL